MTQTAYDRALPAALDSEVQVVGSMLLAPECVGSVDRQLRPTDYLNPLNRAAHIVITAMRREGLPIDVATVRAKLDTRVEFVGESTLAYLAEVGQACVTSAHVAFHVAEVAEASLKRRLHLAATDLAAEALNGKAADEVLADWGAAFNDFQREQDVSAQEIESHSLDEFLELDHRQNFLIHNVITEAQPGVMSAKSKSLKTCISQAAALAIASGEPLLGRYEVPEALPVGIISAESGGATLAESFERIAASMGVDPWRLKNLHVSTRIPLLTTPEGRDQLERFIVRRDLRALFVDPTYKAFAGVEDSQLPQMALHLFPLSEIIDRTGCSIIMVHHNRKTPRLPGAHYAEPTQDEIQGTGFQQWARFFVLLNKRREWDADQGKHWLWFKTEGSAGFGSRQWLDIREGRRRDPGGRVFEVALSDPVEGEAQEREQADRLKDEAKAKRRAAQQQADHEALVKCLAKLPESRGTKNGIREATGLNTARFDAALAAAIQARDVAPCEVPKGNGQSYSGYQLAAEQPQPTPPPGHSDSLGLHSDKTDCPTDTLTQSDNPLYRGLSCPSECVESNGVVAPLAGDARVSLRETD